MAIRTLQVLTDDSPSTEPLEVYEVFKEAAPFLDSSKFKQSPAIPIPFCLRFRKGSTMMRLVSPKELDPFASLRGQGVLPGTPKTILPPKTSHVIPLPSATRTPVVPPRALQRNREVESLKADASSFYSDNELPSGFPSIDTAPRASSSSKASVGRKEPKSKTTVKGSTSSSFKEDYIDDL
ncbi:hypothetical protein C8R41DRAFT_870637 [Lentinula lateritia]|uniref:DUF2439 domain-containing protein n=1 Tax=Lentinula lateritia TaxID=40482 RepID=A0ABQ8V616_9AGAR|nr:hypothetical protein C8R41DRAFT_870637 [Lentinula lateritia]